MDALRILDRAPASALNQNVKGLCHALKDNPDLVQAIEKKYQIPFQIIEPKEGKDKPFLTCPYNRMGDNQYRSPWSNVVHPVEKDASKPMEENELRPLELTLNEVWDSYKNLYYGNESVGSVYLKEKQGLVLEGFFGIQKSAKTGSWSSASVVHVQKPGETECTYEVETSLCLTLDPAVDEGDGTTTKADVSVFVTKSVVKSCKIAPDKVPVNVSHIDNIGTLIEANEIDLRSSVEKVLIPKNVEMLDLIQKKQEKRRPQLNPLMGMVMNSDVLKKKLAREAAAATAAASEK